MTAQIDLPLSTLPPTAQGAIEAFLIGGGFDYSVAQRPEALGTFATGTIPGFGALDLTFYVADEGREIVICVDHGVRLKPAVRAEVLEFIARFNGVAGCGNLEISPESGAVRWRVGWWAHAGSPITLEVVESLVHQLLRADRDVTPRLCRVAEGFESAEFEPRLI